MSTRRPFWRALRQLFHEMTGAVFLCLAALGVLVAFHQWHNPAAPWVAWIAIGFTLMMVAFGLISFRDARRIR